MARTLKTPSTCARPAIFRSEIQPPSSTSRKRDPDLVVDHPDSPAGEQNLLGTLERAFQAWSAIMVELCQRFSVLKNDLGRQSHFPHLRLKLQKGIPFLHLWYVPMGLNLKRRK